MAALVCAFAHCRLCGEADITGRRAQVLEQAIKAHGTGLRGSLAAIQADVSSKEDLTRMAKQISEGHLHILVK